MKQTYFTPKEEFDTLKSKYNCSTVVQLLEATKSPTLKEDRERVFSLILTSGLRSISLQDYRLHIPDDRYSDLELINVTKIEKNKEQRVEDKQPEHFEIQNVQITEHIFKKSLTQETRPKIWDVIDRHLSEKKFLKSTDYNGCILALHLRLNLEGLTSDLLSRIKKKIRSNKQKVFKEIWLTGILSKDINKRYQ